MTCETARTAILKGDGGRRADGLAHLAGCEACAVFVVERTLEDAPPVQIPATFAIDVARRARLEPAATATAPWSRGLAIGLAAAAVLLAGTVFASRAGTDGALAVLPMALLLLACGEAIVLAAWSLTSVVVPGRRERS